MGALEMGENDLKNFVREFEKRRDLICARLDKLSHVFSYIKPNSAYYVFPKINPPYPPFTKGVKIGRTSFIEGDDGDFVDSWQFSLDLLDKAQVAVVPGVAFGPNGEGHVRMSFGRSEEDINKAFDRMETLFTK
jgi:aspartate/methionine/tyrosine aminotransferase